MQQIKIEQVRADSTGNVVSEERGLAVKAADKDNTELRGSFDPNSGQLTISIPNIGTVNITGLPTIHDIGYGPAGIPGSAGRDGVDGLFGADGLRGSDGCEGPRGVQGRTGIQGPDGRRGNRGATGATGATGEQGIPGRVEVYVQEADPRLDNPNIGPGALWIRV